jgi:hypothetical protein
MKKKDDKKEESAGMVLVSMTARWPRMVPSKSASGTPM